MLDHELMFALDRIATALERSNELREREEANRVAEARAYTQWQDRTLAMQERAVQVGEALTRTPQPVGATTPEATNAE